MHRKILAAFLALTMLVLCIPAAAANQIEEASDPKHFSALLEKCSPHRVLLISDRLSNWAGAIRVIHSASTNSYLLEYASAEAAEAGLRELQAHYGAGSCWLDSPSAGARVLGDADPVDAYRSWGAHALELDALYADLKVNQHLQQGTVTVAVIDTGLDPESTFWKERTISPKSYDFVNASGKLSEVPNGNAAGHGTMVVSILDDLLFDRAELMILRVFDNSGSASRARVLNALEYAIENGADIINLSLGWEGADSSYTFLDSILDKAHEQGIAVICASGNKGTDANTCYPASYETTISVSAVNEQGERPAYSNFGSSVDFSAPGQKIKTIGPQDRLMSSSGTSFAAPHITAAVASVLALSRDHSADQLFDALKSSARDLGEEGWDPYYGWGLPQMKSLSDSILTHDWDEGQIVAAPTFDAEGERSFTCMVCGEQRTEILPPATPTPTPEPSPSPVPLPSEEPKTNHPFSDVKTSAYFYDPVLWAFYHNPQIAIGTDSTHFSPHAVCTRAQVVTFLWRAMGQQMPKSTANSFTDVKTSDYYYAAVLWAAEQGITMGTASDTFSPNTPCTRAHVITFLWRAEHKPEAATDNPFLDVAASQYYSDAVKWAVNQSPRITEGTDALHFSPEEPCTRGQIVTFLYRDLAD